MDKKGSKKIAEAFVNRKEELSRVRTTFTGTWKTTMEEFWPLLCPAGEADWIPGWTATVLHSENRGYASENCIFETDESNKAFGPGLWIFTGYEKFKFVELVVNKTNMVIQLRLDVKENSDGTISCTWHWRASSLNTKGNSEVAQFERKLEMESKGLPLVAGHYLETGKMVQAD